MSIIAFLVTFGLIWAVGYLMFAGIGLVILFAILSARLIRHLL